MAKLEFLLTWDNGEEEQLDESDVLSYFNTCGYVHPDWAIEAMLNGHDQPVEISGMMGWISKNKEHRS